MGKVTVRKSSCGESLDQFGPPLLRGEQVLVLTLSLGRTHQCSKYRVGNTVRLCVQEENIGSGELL